MSNLTFPVLKGLTWNNQRTPHFTTVAQASGAASLSGPREVRLAFQSYPIWKYKLVYNYLYARSSSTVSDLVALEGLFCQLLGGFDTFLYDDPERDSVVDQPLTIFTDPASSIKYSQLVAAVGSFLDMVTDLNPLNASGLVVKDNGVTMAAGADFVLVSAGVYGPTYALPGLVVHWTGHNPTGPVTASFSYYHRCRFSGDDLTFEEFLSQIWKNQSVDFESSFDNA